MNLSINYGKVVDSSGYDANKPWIAIAGFDVGLMPGLVAGAEVAYFDNDLPNRLEHRGQRQGLVLARRPPPRVLARGRPAGADGAAGRYPPPLFVAAWAHPRAKLPQSTSTVLCRVRPARDKAGDGTAGP